MRIENGDEIIALIRAHLANIFMNSSSQESGETYHQLRQLHLPQVSSSQCEEIQQAFIEDEITKAMFSVADSKTPGPDEVNAEIFNNRTIVGPDVFKGPNIIFL